MNTGCAPNLCFDLNQSILQFIETRTHCGQLLADVRAALWHARIRSDAPRDSLRHHSRLIFHCYKRSIRSTTPTIAESIAAPAFPVAAVDAPQPSCTIKTVSPTPESTESRAITEYSVSLPSGMIC